LININITSTRNMPNRMTREKGGAAITGGPSFLERISDQKLKVASIFSMVPFAASQLLKGTMMAMP
jgi:hypothetical protein